MAENLVEEVQISQSLLKGKKALTESTSKCLDELDKIWYKFNDDDQIDLVKSTKQQIQDCTQLGSPWILRNTPCINNFYTIKRVLGSPGTYGVVRRAINKSNGDIVAIKHIKKRRYKNCKSQQRYFNDLRNEVYLMCKASDHPHIINCYHVFEDIHTLYLVLEYCEGGELYDLLCQNRQNLNEIVIADLFRQMVSSIYYLHQLGIAHCDLKPENFVFKDIEQTQLVLIDFGMAKIVEFRKYFDVVAGSPYYVAPEVLMNHYDEACDIWALGISLFVMIFGFAPFFDKSNNSKTVYKKILKGFEPTVQKGYGAFFPESQKVTRNCRDLIARMLRTNCADRITAEEAMEHPWLTKYANKRHGENVVDALIEQSDMMTLVPITNPAILNSLKFYKKEKNVFHREVLRLLNGVGYLNQNQTECVVKFLNAADYDGDKKISKKELFEALKQVDKEIKLEDIDSIFTTIDANTDGFVNYEELLTSRINRKLQSKEARLRKVFMSFDYDGDGTITQRELEATWESIQKQSRKSINFQQIIQEVDTNNDGKIDYEEFLSAFGTKSQLNAIGIGDVVDHDKK